MKGHIRTKEKCDACGGNFKDFGHILACEACLSKAKIVIPKRLYLEIFWNGKQRKIYSDNDGRILSNYELAQRVLTEIRQKIDKHKFDPTDYVAKSYQALEFDQYCESFLARQRELLSRGELSASTVENREYLVEKHITNFFKQKDIRDIRAGDIEDFRLQLPKTLKISSQSAILSILSTIFMEAKKRGDIKIIPDFPSIKIPEEQRRWLDQETQAAIFAHIPDRHKPIFTFMFRQGCRPGEARALQWEDVDMVNHRVTIRRTYSSTTYQETTKGKKARTIPLDDQVYEMLKGLQVVGLTGFVFLQQSGLPYVHKTTLCRMWNKACKKAGVSSVYLYEGTRHSFASQAGNSGVELYSLQKFLGHSNPHTTERYTHLNMEGLQRVLDVKEGKVVKLEKSDRKTSPKN